MDIRMKEIGTMTVCTVSENTPVVVRSTGIHTTANGIEAKDMGSGCASILCVINKTSTCRHASTKDGGKTAENTDLEYAPTRLGVCESEGMRYEGCWNNDTNTKAVACMRASGNTDTEF